jgi:molybdenum cofactor biosynthesis enzyme MoaA
MIQLTSSISEIIAEQIIEHVNITGGEPFHPSNNFSTKDIVAYVKDISPKSTFSLNTNAYDISDETTDWIISNCDYIKISLYGTNDFEYKAYSNAACFDRVLSNIDKLSRAGVKIILNVITTKRLLVNNNIYKVIDIANKYSITIRFVELISHQWFSKSKITNYNYYYLSPQLLINELRGYGAILVSSDFNRDVLSLNGLRIESYKYPKSREDASLFFKAGWGVFLRSDGQICTYLDSYNLCKNGTVQQIAAAGE